MIVAIVLGAAVWPGGVPSPTLRRRTEAGVALLAAGRADRLILTGGLGRHPPAEAEAAHALALGLGADPARLVVEARSTSTLANLAEAAHLLPPETAATVVVSNRWHLPRALMIARLLGLPRPRGQAARGDLPPHRLARAVAREIAATAPSLIRAVRARPRSARRSGR